MTNNRPNFAEGACRPVVRWGFVSLIGLGVSRPNAARMNLHNVYGNGQQMAGLDEAGRLDVLSRLTAFSNSDSGRTQVAMQAGRICIPIMRRSTARLPKSPPWG